MDFVDLIIKKRDNKKLSKDEINYFIKGVTDGTIPDYQISSMLMALPSVKPALILRLSFFFAKLQRILAGAITSLSDSARAVTPLSISSKSVS